MFLRELTVKRGDATYTYLKVVESARAQGRIVQRTLVNLGNVAQWPPDRLRALVHELQRFLGEDGPLPSEALTGVQVRDCRQLGPYLAVSQVWEALDLDGLLTRLWQDRRLDPRAVACVKAMVLARLVEPCSKLAVWELVRRDVWIPGVEGTRLPLHAYYRTLDALYETKPAIEQAVHRRLTHLFNRDVSLVFYDLTSCYFEGTACGKARQGYSREHRPDLLQIELGLLVDADGLPIGHEVFDGNVKDVATVLGALDRLQREFGVRRCVFVGDDGMASAKNLATLAARGYEYITSVALGRSTLGRRLLREAPAPWTWPAQTPTLRLRWVGTVDGARYIGSYNPARAAHTRASRRRHLRACLEGLRALQAGPKPRGKKKTPAEVLTAADRLRRKHGCQGLLRVALADERLTWAVDGAALRAAHRLDGVLLLQTNAATLSDGEVAQGYRSLWRVEDAFRHLKDGLRLRPIRHWNDAHVLGHVFVCVLAYLLERVLEQTLVRAGVAMPARAALAELRSLTVAVLECDGVTLRRRSELTPAQRRILAALGLPEVPSIW
jgi:hypothetical protein